MPPTSTYDVPYFIAVLGVGSTVPLVFVKKHVIGFGELVREDIYRNLEPARSPSMA